MKRNALRQIFLLAIALLVLGQAPAHPEISSISPQAAVAGKTVTLTGRQFTADNAILFDSTIIRHIGISSAIGITCTNDPVCRSGIVQTLTFATPMTAVPGPHSVSVQNAYGTSNSVTFTVSK